MKGKRVIDVWNSSEVEPKKHSEMEGEEKMKDDIKISSTPEWLD